eukprot:CAMPEP_0113463834 /NCGR_PEP_ID=MMETSP0014_2-20120614/12875_1 /TAXON_ID=2857 /ORGANISM="Nitzschia sp." /LENGTH=449 /DNA_ID=CAMNT_0000355867 /DNA_START=535 /DNA_END=1882 /DNA_ORIENTATION=+ /assembly_acc=CAM_ASM_000159
MAVWSLGKAYLTDPGAVPLGARPLVTVKRAQSQSSTISNDGDNNGNNGDVSNPTRQQPRQQQQQQRQRAIRRCHKCNDNYKPNRAHHDSVTGRCVVKFDHFCPWVGNAVGALNHKFFVLFVGYTLVSCCFSLVLIAMRGVHCGLPSPAVSSASTTTTSTGASTADNNNNSIATEDRLEECRGWDESYLGSMLFVVSVVFGIFTSCMLCEQIDAIKTNRSKIARMKMSVGGQGTELSRVTEEFNEMFGGRSQQVAWHWFVPLDVEFPRGMDKVVLGYEWDISFEQVPYQEPTHDNGNSNGHATNSNGSSSSNTPNAAAVRDLEMGTMRNGGGGGGIACTANNGPLGSPGGGTPTSSRPPSRTPSSSSSSSKDKNSDHEIGSGGGGGGQKDGLRRVSLDRDDDDDGGGGGGGSSTLVPSASSPQPAAKSRSYKEYQDITAVGNSHDNDNDE